MHQWRASLANYVFPVIGDLNVADVGKAHVLEVLTPIWETIPETARRVRGKIEQVLTFATARDFRTGDNPARHDLISTLLGSAKVEREHLAAMPYADVPAFADELRRQEGVPPRALEFAILTCAWTGACGRALWSEIDWTAVWPIPADALKTRREHRSPCRPGLWKSCLALTVAASTCSHA